MSDADTKLRTDNPQRTSRYASDAMAERRARILEAAREMLVEQGGKFTMRDLAKRSGVALATLYNIFDSQDELVAQAVVQIFVDRVENLIPKETGSVLELIEHQQDLAHAEILRVPAYAKKMLSIYFSEETDSQIRDVLQGQAVAGNTRILKILAGEKALGSWVDVDLLANDMAVASYAVISRWAAGEVSDQVLLLWQKHLRLTMLAGAVTGKYERLVKKRLGQIVKEINAGEKSQ